jgi:hypothetical protein
VIRHRRNPLRPRRGNAGAQEPLPLELQQLALHHRQRAPVVGGDESHQHPEEEGEQLCYCSRVRAREMARRQRQEQERKVEGATAGRPKDIYRRQTTNRWIRQMR